MEIDRMVSPFWHQQATQLDECNITIRDIRLVKEGFLESLSGQHHRRVDYPGYAFTFRGDGGEVE